jgi:tetratricopeptide (TPR) repeat protein
VTGGPFGRSAQATAAEKQFLSDILKLLRKFGTDADGLTPDIRGECLFRVGLLQLRLGQEGEAEKTFRDALAVWEKLNTDTPSATTPRLEMAKVCSELGWVMMRKNQPDAARELFDRAVTTADALAEDQPTPVHQALKSKVRGIRADFYFRRGDVRKAVDELTAVVTLLKQLAGDNSTDRVRAFELAATLDRLAGSHEQLNEGPKADALWADALNMFERLAEAYPQDLEIVQSLARVLSAMGRRADGPPAVEYYLRALAVRKRLMTDYPAVPQYRMDYAASAANLAAHLTDAGDLKGAETLAADALDIRVQLAKDFPTLTTHLAFLAHSRCVSGRLARLTGKSDTAAELLDKAVAGIDPLHTRDPRWFLGREIHAMCHSERASQLEERREYAKAADDWAAVAASVGEPAEPTARRALALAKAGKSGMAADAAGALRKQEPKDWRVQFVLARVYATLSATEPTAGHTSTAAACLRAAVAGGLPDRPQWKWEPDLDPVRGNTDVAAVLGKLKAAEVLPRPRPEER